MIMTFFLCPEPSEKHLPRFAPSHFKSTLPPNTLTAEDAGKIQILNLIVFVTELIYQNIHAPHFNCL